MQILYNIVAILLVILLIPYFIVRTIREKGFLKRMIQSFGFLPEHALDKVAGKNTRGRIFLIKRSGSHGKSKGK